MGIQDILHLIAEFLEPDIVTYCRLLAVNRDFYGVFTSDRVWAPLDVYGHQERIYDTFRGALREPHAPQFLACAYKNPQIWRLKPNVVTRLTANRFMWLVYITRNIHSIGHFAIYRHLLKSVITVLWGFGHREPRLPRIFQEILGQDDELALFAVKTNASLLQSLSAEQNADHKLVMAAILAQETRPRDWPAIRYVTANLRLDKKIGAAALRVCPESVLYVSQIVVDEHFKGRESILQAALREPQVLSRVTEFQHDKEFFMDFLKAAMPSGRYTGVLQYASDEIRSDYDVCRRALEVSLSNYAWCTCYDVRLLTDFLKHSSFSLTRSEGESLAEYIDMYDDPEIFRDRELCKLIVECSPRAFSSLPEWRRDDRELALASVDMLSEGLANVTGDLRTDPSFYVECIQKLTTGKGRLGSISDMWEYVQTRDDPAVVRAAVAAGMPPIHIDEDTNSNWASDLEMMELYVEAVSLGRGPVLHPDSFNLNRKEELCDNEKLIKAAVALRGCALHEASPRLQDSAEVVQAAFKPRKGDTHVCFPYTCVSERLMADEGFVRSLINLCGVAPAMLANQNDLLNEIHRSEDYWSQVPTTLRADPEFLVSAVRANVAILNFLRLDQVTTNSKLLEAACTIHTDKVESLCSYCLDVYNGTGHY